MFKSQHRRVAVPKRNLTASFQIGHTIAKWVLILMTNVALIIFLRRYRSRGKQLQSVIAPTQESVTNQMYINNANRILVGCVTLYTICMFPQIVYTCLKVASRPPYCSYNFPENAQRAARPFTQTIWLTNYATSFLLYCGVSRKFRRKVWRICRPQGSHPRNDSKDQSSSEPEDIDLPLHTISNTSSFMSGLPV